jgi:S-(hydroxymethyl)mycothiol dehydrogenase
MGQRLRRDPYRQPEGGRRGRPDQGDHGRVRGQRQLRGVGNTDALKTAIWCRDLAGTCVIIGVADRTKKIEFSVAEFFDLGGQLRSSWYGDCLPTRDFPLLASLYAQGRLDLDGVVTKVITLEEAEEAFHAMERGETLRSVIRL